MSTTVSSPAFSISAQATLKSGTAPLATTTTPVNFQFAVVPTVGSSSGNVNAVYATTTTINSGSNLDLDLTTLVDSNGNSILATQLAGYAISVTGSTGAVVTVGEGTNPLIASAETSEPINNNGARGEWFGDGPITVDSSHKVLRLAASGANAIVQIVLFLKT